MPGINSQFICTAKKMWYNLREKEKREKKKKEKIQRKKNGKITLDRAKKRNKRQED